MHILPFTADMVEDAAKLLASRHQKDRLATAALPCRFEREQDARIAIETEWKKQGTSGAAAIKNGKLVGYLFGEKTASTIRGRHVWASLASHSLASGQSAELYQDLYAAAAQTWVDEGYFTHFTLIPAQDASALHAWFCLGFGHEQAHGTLSLETLGKQTTTQLPLPGAQLRLATMDDRQALGDVSPWIRTHQTMAPVFGIALPEEGPKIREGYSRLVEDPEVSVWIVEQVGQILSFQAYFPSEEDPAALLVPEKSVELGVAGTRPDARGMGLNHVLTQRGLQHAREKGAQYVLTDWRMTNLQSSRHWPRQGFVPTAYRLTRAIDPRIAWARG